MEIVYIPEKPPIQPHQQPTVDVLVAHIDAKLANTLIRCLNRIAPLEGLRHVKRVRNHKHLQPHLPQPEGQGQGKSELCVILCRASENVNGSCSMPQEVQELITSHHLTVFRTKVCQYAATSKEEWEEQCKLWPTSFHPPTYNIDGITGFSNEDSESIFSFMNQAIQLAKSGGDSVVNAAIIVDPSVKQIISSACDQTRPWNTPPDKDVTEARRCKQRELFGSNPNSEGRLSCKTSETNSLPDETKDLYGGVSCLFPWGWAEQKSSESCSSDWHPLRHAAIVAIESSAARDRLLFPSVDEIQDVHTDTSSICSFSAGSPVKRQKTNSEKVMEKSHSPAARPYLCTGYDIYLAWEPCPMCAMALVHQRIRRIFFAFPNKNVGALGSVLQITRRKKLKSSLCRFQSHDAFRTTYRIISSSLLINLYDTKREELDSGPDSNFALLFLVSTFIFYL